MPELTDDVRVKELQDSIAKGGPSSAAKQLLEASDSVAAQVLEKMIAPHALKTLEAFPSERRSAVLAGVSEGRRRQWEVNERFGEDTVGRLMELPVGTFPAETTITDAIEHLREIVKRSFITYLYVTDEAGRLRGLVVMREMLLADRSQTLGEVMLKNPFSLAPEMALQDAMKEAVQRHFPVYPVCDAEGRLVGLVRGDDLFEQNVYQLIVQAGSMVGVEKEERLATAWPRALRLRNPWLLVNLLTAFVAGAVVGLFEETIAQVTALAAFLPVLAGQSGNTGCQALAVTLRGMALGELSDHSPVKIVVKEAFLGLLNGAVVGVLAGGAMFFFAQGQTAPLTLAGIVVAAMIGSCIASGVAGALVPIGLKRLGADPATASSIFLTTATDVVSMGLLLGLATILLV
jgi:magnesium transporter